MSFSRCYQNGQISGYISTGRCDCAFVYAGGAKNEFSLEELVTDWNAAAAGAGGVQQRALFFFPRITTDVVKNARKFLEDAIGGIVWNKITYWSSPEPTGGRIWFPNGSETQVKFQQWDLALAVGGTPQAVADFGGMKITVEGGSRLLIKREGMEWLIGNRITGEAVARAAELEIDLSDLEIGENKELQEAGALGVGVLRAALSQCSPKIAYSRIQKDTDDAFTCVVVQSAHFAAELASDSHAVLALDPRDDSNDTFVKRTQRSRLLFAENLPFVSHLMTDRGEKILLESKGTSARGFGRMQYDITGGTIVGDEWVFDRDKLHFIPHGEFRIAGLAGMPGAFEGCDVRIMLGGSATEFVPVKVGDMLIFHAGKKAVLAMQGDLRPPGEADPVADDKTVLDDFNDGKGFITTSWMSTASIAEFHTQPENSPVFEVVPETAGQKNPLQRKTVPYGSVTQPIPFFPHAGTIGNDMAPADAGDGDVEFVPDYEQIFLSKARQVLTRKTNNPPGPMDDAEPATKGIAPQGIISTQTSNNFAELRFGDPSGKPDSPGEFVIKFNAAGTLVKAYEEIQQGLRGKDLFLVMTKMSADAKALITVSSDVHVRDFQFHLGADLGDSVLVLKYFKDRSLEDLLSNESMWGCKALLARNTKWKGGDAANPSIRSKCYAIDNNGKESMPASLLRIWKDKNWQGLLLLDLVPPKGGLPNLFEALKPAMVEGALRLHHLGLNYLPVKDGDMKADVSRPCSAFGLMLYAPGGNKPGKPVSDDKHPDPQHKPDTSYHLEVKTMEVEFRNSQVVRFNALVEASFSHLFWDDVGGDGAANKMHVMALNGSYEARANAGGGTSDVFTLATTDKQEVKFKNAWIDKFVVSRAEFVITRSDVNAKRLVSFLGFTGDLAFKEPKDFKLFEVKKITVEKLGLEFDYDYSKAPPDYKCRFRADSIRADVDFGEAKDALLSVLGLKFKGFRMALSEMLNFDRLGYLPLGWDGKGIDFHFGLDFDLDFGFLGKLAGGKALKFPLLLGWRAGGFDLGNLGIGISFPNWNGKHFEIGIQSFISIRADSAVLKPCKEGDKITSFAIVLAKARLVFLGCEWPREADMDLALFVPAGGGRRMSWALARTGAQGEMLKYIAAGHRIQMPEGNSTKEVVESFKNILKNVKDDKKETDACSLLPQKGSSDGWMVAGEFTVAKIVDLWIAACDDPQLYGLRVELLKSGFSADAMYRQLSPRVGVFSAEVSLPESLRTWQIGIATARLPKFGLDVFTDGGFKVDLGYPWNNDFKRSFQLEIGIFLGSGGMWFSYTSGIGADWIAVKAGEVPGYNPPSSELMERYQAISAGVAMRAGIGRSFELGILRGEASLTVFTTLEGGIAYLRGSGDHQPVLYGIRGTMGVMIRIWVEVNFIVLRATAEFCAYALVGFEIRRLLAQNGSGEGYAITMPIKVFAEVGIYVHVEVWVTIGCVRVKLFDLEFSGTWHWEETLGGFSAEKLNLNGTPADMNAIMDAVESLPVVNWRPDYRAFPADEALVLVSCIMPCVADPEDIEFAAATQKTPSVVMQLMLRTRPPEGDSNAPSDFLKLAKFMLGWVLNPSSDGTTEINRSNLHVLREVCNGDDVWIKLMDLLADQANPCALLQQFKVSFDKVDPTKAGDCAALPGWPGVSWHFIADKEGNGPPQGDNFHARDLEFPKGVRRSGDLCMFVDYLRALTGSLLSESERLVTLADKSAGHSTTLTWDALWAELVKEA